MGQEKADLGLHSDSEQLSDSTRELINSIKREYEDKRQLFEANIDPKNSNVSERAIEKSLKVFLMFMT